MITNTKHDTVEPLRILMTADAVGGVWQYCVDLARGLSARGCELILATFGPRPSSKQQAQIRAIERVKLFESDYALEWMPNRWDEIDAGGIWLAGLDSQFKPHIVHLNGYAHASLGWGKPVIVMAHSCVYSWWRAVHGCAPGPEWSEYGRRVTRGLAAADAVVSPSAFMAGALERDYGADREKIRIIHNFSRFPRSRTRNKQPFCLAAGRIWDPAKNLSLLDSVAPKIDWEIRIAGSEHGPLNSTAPGESVRFLGSLPHAEMLAQMRRASIFVHPALYEPFGLSVLEAARSRCCLVLSNIPSLRELWDGAAVFADAHDPDCWVFEIDRLIGNPDDRDKLAGLAQCRAARYRGDAAVRTYSNLYTSLLNSRKDKSKEAAA